MCLIKTPEREAGQSQKLGANGYFTSVSTVVLLGVRLNASLKFSFVYHYLEFCQHHFENQNNSDSVAPRLQAGKSRFRIRGDLANISRQNEYKVYLGLRPTTFKILGASL
jgi:hypothetical protein